MRQPMEQIEKELPATLSAVNLQKLSTSRLLSHAKAQRPQRAEILGIFGGFA
jgi:hypothetical protein